MVLTAPPEMLDPDRKEVSLFFSSHLPPIRHIKKVLLFPLISVHRFVAFTRSLRLTPESEHEA